MVGYSLHIVLVMSVQKIIGRICFEDRTNQVAKISDEEIDAWVNQDNYTGLAEKLKAEEFKGWIPDLKNLHLGSAAFDENGFAKDGSYWVAFNYKPFPSTFWPTNGSTDDVMIRLAEPFRTDEDGNYSVDTYKANLGNCGSKCKRLRIHKFITGR